MNRLIWGVLAITGLTSCASTAAPTPGAAPPRPTAAALQPPLDSLAFYVGSWRCKGTFFATPDEPEEKWEATLTVEPELDGTWLSVKMTGPGSSRTIEHKGYDPTSKRWIHVAIINKSGRWASSSSAGWTGSQMVFTPDDKTETSVATFSKLSETSYSHVVTRNTDHGVEKDWEKFCTKM